MCVFVSWSHKDTSCNLITTLNASLHRVTFWGTRLSGFGIWIWGDTAQPIQPLRHQRFVWFRVTPKLHSLVTEINSLTRFALRELSDSEAYKSPDSFGFHGAPTLALCSGPFSQVTHLLLPKESIPSSLCCWSGVPSYFPGKCLCLCVSTAPGFVSWPLVCLPSSRAMCPNVH